MAIIIRSNFSSEGIEFFTPNDFSQQLGYMNRPAGYIIEPHVHNIVKREVELTNEVIFIKSGLVRVDFYDDEHCFGIYHIYHYSPCIFVKGSTCGAVVYSFPFCSCLPFLCNSGYRDAPM